MRTLTILAPTLILLIAPSAGADHPCAQKAFEVSGETESWEHRRTRYLTVKSGRPRHRVQDVVAVAGSRPVAIGKFAYGKVDKDLSDERVTVYLRPSCRAWRRVVDARTSDDEGGTRHGVADDGGRVFASLPDTLEPGQHHVEMLVRGDHTRAGAPVFVVQRGTQVVVFDIDGTLTTGDGEIVTEIIGKMEDREYVPAVRAAAPDVARAWAEKGYLIVYITGRPDNLKRRSVEWLKKKGFPPGPIHLTDQLRQAMPSWEGVGRYKADYLGRLQKEFGLEIVAGYGNATTDIRAYAQAGLSRGRTYIAGEHGGKSDTVALGDGYSAHLEAARAMPRATRPAPSGLHW